MDITGRYGNARIFAKSLENEAIDQIRELLDQPFTKGSKIRIMPDAHSGAGCVIGTTMTVSGKAVPNLVGVDIGCGMLVIRLDLKQRLSVRDLAKLDHLIRDEVPSGFGIRKSALPEARRANIEDLQCAGRMDLNRANLSIGTLGGGNHFIELDMDDSGETYLVIHSGSRHLGKQLAEHYQSMAGKSLSGSGIPRYLAYLEGADFKDYLHDITIVQKYADLNRHAMARVLLSKMGWGMKDEFSTIHNYIDIEGMVLRKGSVSAKKGELLLIPMNMRDGSLLCTGKGNEDWNLSAPHGAGRLMSRHRAKDTLSMERYIDSMKGIFTTSVSRSTLDEAPDAYKPMDEILDSIGDTVTVYKTLKPIYNFKSP
jgi:RNA-splicing ligase RtcB